MQLIRKTEKKIYGTRNVMSAIFICPICNKEVEREYSEGKKQSTCSRACSNKTHGETKTLLYKRWVGIKKRCINPKSPNYYKYGGRGIKICNEWMDYEPFRDWALSNGWDEKLQIDRIDNNGNYEPLNCRFVTNLENSRNRPHTKLNEDIVKQIRSLHTNTKQSAIDLAKKYGVSWTTIYEILRRKTWKTV